MQVIKLLLKTQPQAPMVERSSVELICGAGMAGDINAQVGSPRQLLMADQRSLDRFQLWPGALRENILFDTGLETLVSGHLLQIGTALIRPTFSCEPCAYLETLRPGLARHIKGHRGFLGMVVGSGAIAVGDVVTIHSDRLPGLPETAKGRFYEFVARIPAGKVVTTADIVLALGVTRAYYRVLPSFIRQAPEDLPVHRIVARDLSLLSPYIPDQAERLTGEGVKVRNSRVEDCDRWPPQEFHQGLAPKACSPIWLPSLS
jgi:alkylated DNA nucleotide flippase Atl1